MRKLFKPVVKQKAPAGVDPKTILCQLHKEGLCTLGAKCQFSHDKSIARKSVKLDVYADRRDEEKKEGEGGLAFFRSDTTEYQNIFRFPWILL